MMMLGAGSSHFPTPQHAGATYSIRGCPDFGVPAETRSDQRLPLKIISAISFDSRILPFLSEMDIDVQRKSPYLRRRTDAHRAF